MPHRTPRTHLVPARLAACLTLAFALLVPATASAAYVGTWFWQNPIPHGSNLVAIDFAGDTGWAVGSGVVLRTRNGGGQWAVLYGFPGVEGRRFTDVEAVDTDNVWVLASDGSWFHSSDCGETWADCRPQDGTSPQAIEFVDAHNGWVADAVGGTWRTADGGATWSLATLPISSSALIVRRGAQMVITDGTSIVQVSPVTGDSTLTATLNDAVTSIAYADSDTLVGVTYMGMFTRSDNGGRTWTALKPVNRYATDLDSLVFVSATTGYCTGNGAYWRTTDAGHTWARYNPTFVSRAGTVVSTKCYPAAFTYSNGRWFTVGSSGALMYSRDSGASWRYVSGDFFDRLVDMSMETTRSGLILADNAAYRTSDSGATWTRQSVPDIRAYSALSLAPNHQGWIVGSDRLATYPYYTGAIFRTADGGRTFARQTVPSTIREINDVWTNDGVTGWAAGMAREARFRGLLKTTDGGAHWRQANIDWSGMHFDYPDEDRPIYTVKVHSGGLGYARATNGLYSLETTDSGSNWHNAGIAGRAFEIVDANTAFAGTYAGWIYTKTYPSATWTRLAYLRGGAIEDIRFVTPLSGYAIAGSSIYRTDDGGLTWALSNANAGATRIATAGDSDAWAIGQGGKVLYNGGLSGDFVPPTTRTSAPVGWDDASYTYVSLSPSDSTGIDSTWWAIGEPAAETRVAAAAEGASSSSLTYLPYKARIKVSAEGVTPITFYSRDVNGNLERPRTVRIMLDRRRPTVTSNATSLYGGSATVKITASDPGSGVRYTYLSVDGKTTLRRTGAVAYVKTGVGTHSVTYWAVDRLGHYSYKVTKRFTVRPLASFSSPSVPTTASLDSAFTVSGYLYPKHSSAAPVVVRAYRWDGADWVLTRTIPTYTRTYSSGSKYSVRLPLPSAGSWRFAVTHQDSGHYLSWSPYRYTTCIE